MARARSFANGAGIAAILSLFLWQSDAHAQAGPALPCGIETVPNYPAPNAPSTEKLWRPSDVGKQWAFPACTGWGKSGFSTLVTTVARFRYAGNADGLLQRIGAISELTGVRYWSASHARWQTLIVSATAFKSATDKSHRADFAPDEMRHGTVLYFQQADNLFGKALYRMRVTESTPDRIVVAVENADAMHYALLPLAGAGDLQSVYIFDRESPDVWRFFSIVRTGPHASGLITAKSASSINRAVAFYRHYAGIRTDLDPPSAR